MVFYIVINVLLVLLLAGFIVFSVLWLNTKKSDVYGVVVDDDGKVAADGRQGLETTLGRAWHNDVRVPDPQVSLSQAVVSYNSRKQQYENKEYGIKADPYVDSYVLGGREYLYSMPYLRPEYTRYNAVAVWLCMGFVTLQAVSTAYEWRTPLAIVPHLILLLYVLSSQYLRTDRAPVIECAFACLLTYYIDATMYPARYADEPRRFILNAILGVLLYTCCAILTNLFFKIKKTFSEPVHTILRGVAVLGIAVIVILNIVLAKEVNGAYNWITIAGISFQPSELVKILLLFVMIVPTGEEFGTGNVIFMIIVNAVCLLYGVLIKDMGLVLQFVVISVMAVLLQTNKVLRHVILFAGLFVGVELILKISATASQRFSGWLGEGFGILEVFTGAGIFMNADSYGYQSVHALVAALKNGALFGNNGFDVLRGITAGNSDLVMAFVAQKHGCVALFLVLALYGLMIVAVMHNIKQQTKLQQKISGLGITIIVFTMILNLAGTFGILALTGVVSPAVSAGISASISYGCLFGALSVSSLDAAYMKKLNTAPLVEQEEPVIPKDLFEEEEYDIFE